VVEFDLSGSRDVIGHVTIKFDEPFSIGDPLEGSLSPAVFDISGGKRIGVTGSTFRGHVTSSVT